jgi:hypothetical protein
LRLMRAVRIVIFETERKNNSPALP